MGIKNRMLSVRLTVWFVILAIIPFTILSIFVMNNVKLEMEKQTLSAHAKKFELILSTITRTDKDPQVVIHENFPKISNHCFFIHLADSSLDNAKSTDSMLEERKQVVRIVLDKNALGLTAPFFTENGQSVVAFAPVKNSLLVYQEDSNDGIKQFYQLRQKSISQVAIGLLVAAILSGLMIWLFVGRAVKAMTDASMKIGRGEFGVQIDTEDTVDELTYLAETFNQMSSEIRNLFTNLETQLNNVRLAKADVEKSEAFFKALLENAQDIITILDENGVVRYESPSVKRIVGFSIDELTGKSIFDFIRESDCSRVQKVLEHVVGSPHGTIMDRVVFDHRHKDGSFRTLESISQNLTLEPNVRGIVVNTRDITEQRKAEEQIQQIQKMDAVGKLAGGIAHDFNNMLGGILGAAEIIQLTANEDEKEMLDIIIKASKKASNLARELLIFSRKTPKLFSLIDVHTIIEETEFLLTRTLDRKIQIHHKLLSQNHTIFGDETLLQSALVNMGINSSHAMPEGGVLSIETSDAELDEIYCQNSPYELVPGKYIAIKVSDTGCGMAPEVQEHVFEPFFTTKEVGKGTGLGMAAVYSMVVKHMGAIAIYSEVGKGTAITILLPVTQNEASIEEIVELPIITGSGSILIVDDEEILRVTSMEMLRMQGYTVFGVSSGVEAIEFLRHNDVDVIIIDMIMPIMNGRETFEKILEINPSTKVILASGFSREHDVNAMIEKGLFGVLQKPFRRHEISKLVSEAIKSGKI